MGLLVSACGHPEAERDESETATALAAAPAVEAPAKAGLQDSQSNGILLQQHLRQQARLWDVSAPMLSEGVEVCHGQTRPNFGFVAWTRWDIERRYRIAAMGVLGLDDRLRVVHILPGSPAAEAGLLAGDEIEMVGRHRMPTGKSAGAALELVLQRETLAGAPSTFRVRRGDARRMLEIVPRTQCAVDLVVTDSDQVNAFTHDGAVYLTRGLMGVLHDDRELAALTAHFIGHSLLGHRPSAGETTAAGKVRSQLEEREWALLDEEEKANLRKVGALPGFRAYSLAQEMQADRAALELMARADYPLEVLVEVWHSLVEARDGELKLWRFHAPS
ncbi:MAG: M48 family metalloprotease, partial [Thiotrichales bacterium]|nr:M48 family metalloprotease [Thiotrichales bacterium]